MNHSVYMDNDNKKKDSKKEEPKKSSSVHKPTQQEIESDIDLINPDENTLDRG